MKQYLCLMKQQINQHKIGEEVLEKDLNAARYILPFIVKQCKEIETFTQEEDDDSLENAINNIKDNGIPIVPITDEKLKWHKILDNINSDKIDHYMEYDLLSSILI